MLSQAWSWMIWTWRLVLKHEHELMISDELPLVKLRASGIV